MSRAAAVIGAGLMGRGIAQVFAAAGWTVAVHDADRAILSDLAQAIAADADGVGRALEAGLIRVADSLEAAVDTAEFVTEAVVEDLAIKRALFARLDALTPADVLLATNTSALSITEIAADVAEPGRVLGTHWWNPAALVPLVELVPGELTAPRTIDRADAALREIGKAPVRLKRDVPGFVGNRLQHALWREAIAIVESGIAEPEDVDRIVKTGFGLRLSVLGPIENADLVGLPLTKAIHDYLLPYLDARAQPSPLLEEHIARRELGMSTGRGLRDWSPAAAEAVRDRLRQHLMKANLS